MLGNGGTRTREIPIARLCPRGYLRETAHRRCVLSMGACCTFKHMTARSYKRRGKAWVLSQEGLRCLWLRAVFAVLGEGDTWQGQAKLQRQLPSSARSCLSVIRPHDHVCETDALVLLLFSPDNVFHTCTRIEREGIRCLIAVLI